MDLKNLRYNLEGIPHTSPEDGETLYNFILKTKPKRILELGFDHGVSTCWMAAAAKEVGCTIDTIDRPDALNSKPDIYENLKNNNLEKIVNVIITERTYIWELRNLIRGQTEEGNCKPLYDFCFIDGAHNWETDGFAFFLVDKLLKPSGWLLFDDLEWTYNDAKVLSKQEWVKRLPEIEKSTPQIRDVVELLVSQHPNYGKLEINGKWAWLQKTNEINSSNFDFNTIYKKPSIKKAFIDFLYAIKKRI